MTLFQEQDCEESQKIHLNLITFYAYIAKGVLVSFGSNETFAVFDGAHKKIDDC